MAKENDKLGYRDFFDDALFTPVIENVQALINTLQALRDTIKAGIVPTLTELRASIHAFTESQRAGSEELRKVAEATSKARETAKTYSKIQEQIIKLTDRKVELESEEAKRLAILKLEIREAEKALKRYAQASTSAARAAEALEMAEKALKGQIDANTTSYFNLSDALDDLRERYKSLLLAGQANTEEASRLRDAIVQLDARIKQADAEVGQFQRNVGNYARSFKEAMTEFLGAQGPAGEAVLALSFAAERARDAFVAAGGGVKGFFRAITEGAKALRGVGIMLLLEGIGKLLSLGRDIEALENAERKLALTREEIRLNNELAAIKLRLEALDNSTIAGIAERGRLIQAQYQREVELIMVRRRAVEEELRKANEAIKDEIDSPLNKILSAIGKALGGIVRMLAYIPKGLAEVLSALGADNAAKALGGVADKALAAAAGIEKLFASFGAANLAQQKEKIASLEQELSDLVQREAELRQRYEKEAEELNKRRQEIAEKAIEALRAEVESTATARQRLRDEYNKRLEDLRANLAEAERILAGSQEDIERARAEYARSVELLMAEMARKDADLIAQAQRNIEAIRREVGMAALEAEVAEINERFAIYYDRLREAFAELGEEDQELLVQLEERRRAAVQRAILRAAEREQKLREEIATTLLETEREKFATEEEFARYRERRLAEIQIEGAKERLEILRELYNVTGDEAIRLEIAKAEATIAQATARLKAIAAREAQEAAKSQQEIVKEYIRAVEAISDALDKYLERIEAKQTQRLQRQQDTIRSRIAVYEGLARQGALSAEQSIAELEAREADLVRSQEELKKKAQRREMALAAIKTYVQLLDRNAPSPLAQTIRDITAISQFISKLPIFYKGTEFVKEGVRIPNAIRDALIVRVHEGERIVPASINRQLGGIKNEELPLLVREANSKAHVEFDYDSLSRTIVSAITEGSKKKTIRRKL